MKKSASLPLTTCPCGSIKLHQKTILKCDDTEQPLMREIKICTRLNELSDHSDALADLLFNENADTWVLDEVSLA